MLNLTKRFPKFTDFHTEIWTLDKEHGAILLGGMFLLCLKI